MFCLRNSVYLAASFGIFFEGNPFPFTELIWKFPSTQISFFFQNTCLESEKYQSPPFQVTPLYKAYKVWCLLLEWCSTRIGSAAAAPLPVHLLYTSTKHLILHMSIRDGTPLCPPPVVTSVTCFLLQIPRLAAILRVRLNPHPYPCCCSGMLATCLSAWDMWVLEMAQKIRVVVYFSGQLYWGKPLKKGPQPPLM